MANRGLTRAQAESGFIPPRLIKREWLEMWAASVVHENAAKERTALALATLLPVYCDRSLPPSADD